MLEALSEFILTLWLVNTSLWTRFSTPKKGIEPYRDGVFGLWNGIMDASCAEGVRFSPGSIPSAPYDCSLAVHLSVLQIVNFLPNHAHLVTGS